MKGKVPGTPTATWERRSGQRPIIATKVMDEKILNIAGSNQLGDPVFDTIAVCTERWVSDDDGEIINGSKVRESPAKRKIRIRSKRRARKGLDPRPRIRGRQYPGPIWGIGVIRPPKPREKGDDSDAM
jgi:hypothetical protein